MEPVRVITSTALPLRNETAISTYEGTRASWLPSTVSS